MRAPPTLATSAQCWQTGGILKEIRWTLGASRIRMWTGEHETVRPGDAVLVLLRGLPAVDFVRVLPGPAE